MTSGARLLLWVLGGLFLATAVLWIGADTSPVLEHRRYFSLWRGLDMVMAVMAIIVGVALGLPRRGLIVAIFATVLFVVMWLFLEFAGVLGIVSYPQLFGYAGSDHLGAHPVLNVDVTGVAPMDTATMWGLESETIPFHFQTDSRGYRNGVDRAEADVYIIGDSFVVSGLLPIEDTVAAQVESALGRSTMTIGLSGISPQEEAARLFDAGVPLENRLVVHMLFEGNDLVDTFRETIRAQAGDDAKDPFALPWSKRTLAYNVARLLQTWSQPVAGQALSQTCSIDDTRYTFLWLENAFRGREAELQAILRTLETTASRVRAAGGHYVVALIPSKFRVLADHCTFPEHSRLVPPQTHLSPMPAALASWTETSGIPVLDLTPALQATAGAGDIPWFWGDTHWNAVGSRAAASALLNWSAVQRWNVQNTAP